MPHNSNVVRANILRGFSHFVENRGVAVAPLLQDAGLRTSDLNDFERDLPFNSVAHLMESAAAACKDASFGLALAKAYPVGGMGLFSFLVLNSTTIEDALRTVVRYVPLIKIPFRFTFEMQQRSACVAWQATEDVTRGAFAGIAQRLEHASLNTQRHMQGCQIVVSDNVVQLFQRSAGGSTTVDADDVSVFRFRVFPF